MGGRQLQHTKLFILAIRKFSVTNRDGEVCSIKSQLVEFVLRPGSGKVSSYKCGHEIPTCHKDIWYSPS